jgi:UDP-N-acetylmuramyl pentapeptide phosphotransferase/UDP-N-acetylglucosamine-1-phosphate transferase
MSALFTIAWFVLYMNAINRFDGVYGLATGVSTVGFWTICGLLALVVFPSYALIDSGQIAVLNIALWFSFLLGIIGLIYMRIEYKPRGLLRDIGTVLMGFLLAYLSLL